MVAPLFRRKGQPGHKFPRQLSTDPPVGPVQQTFYSSQENLDLGIEAWHRGTSLLKQGILGAVVLVAPQFDPSLQLQAKVFPSVRTPPVAATAVETFVQGAPELADLSIEAWHRGTTLLKQGPVPPFSSALIQLDSSQTSRIWTSLPTPPVAVSTVSPLVTTAPQWAQTAAQVWPSVRTPPVAGLTAPFVSAAPELIDLSIEGWHRGTSLSGGIVIGTGSVPPITATPQQANPTQIAAQVWSSARTPPAPGNLSSFIKGAPEVVDLGIEGWTRQPSLLGSAAPGTPGPFTATILIQPQYDVSSQGGQIWEPASSPQGSSSSAEYRFGGHALALWSAEGLKSRLFRPVATPPPLFGPLGIYVRTVPQIEDRPYIKSWASQIAGQVTPIIPLVSGGPQLIDLTQQATLLSTTFTPPILGVTVRSNPPVPPQADTSSNPSVVWTPSTFSPSGPLPVEVGIPAPIGHPVYIKGQRKKPRIYETANEQLKKILQSITIEVVTPESKSTDAPVLVKAVSGKPVRPATSAEAPAGFMPAAGEPPAPSDPEEEEIIALMAKWLV